MLKDYVDSVDAMYYKLNLVLSETVLNITALFQPGILGIVSISGPSMIEYKITKDPLMKVTTNIIIAFGIEC